MVSTKRELVQCQLGRRSRYKGHHIVMKTYYSGFMMRGVWKVGCSGDRQFGRECVGNGECGSMGLGQMATRHERRRWKLNDGKSGWELVSETLSVSRRECATKDCNGGHHGRKLEKRNLRRACVCMLASYFYSNHTFSQLFLHVSSILDLFCDISISRPIFLLLSSITSQNVHKYSNFQNLTYTSLSRAFPNKTTTFQVWPCQSFLIWVFISTLCLKLNGKSYYCPNSSRPICASPTHQFCLITAVPLPNQFGIEEHFKFQQLAASYFKRICCLYK